MIFLTVGSMFPFDRLIQAVDEMVADKRIAGPVFAQIGDGAYEPRHMPFSRFLPKEKFESNLSEARAVIAHAGAGTIAVAQAHRKPLLVVPRLRQFSEHVNDHQVGTARRYEELGHVLVAYTTNDIPEKLKDLKEFNPSRRTANAHGLAVRIGDFLKASKH